MLLRVVPLGALAGVVVWLVFAIMLGIDMADDGMSAVDVEHRAFQAETAFQGVVAIAVVYIMLKQ